MAAVLQLSTSPSSTHRHVRPRMPCRARRAAVYRRRRFVAAAIGLGLALTVVRAGAALGGSSPGIAGRRPHVQTVVVRPGDTLWSVARRVAPHSDPRAVVDALVQARGSSTVVPGETITWLRP